MSQELQQRFDALETERQALNPNNADDRFRLAVIEQQQADLRAQMETADRIQRQAAEVAEIELPEDYDERWGAEGANDEIRNLLRQVKEFLFGQHNDEMAKLQEVHQERVKALEESKAVLIDHISVLETRLEETEAKLLKSDIDRLTALDHQNDAEQKRDNAIAAKEEAEADRDKLQSEVKSLKSQIDELEGMLRTYRSRSSGGVSGGLVLTSTLPKETEEERKARQERERVEEINRNLERRGLDPLPLPPSPALETAPTAAEALEDDRFPTDEIEDDAGGLAPADESTPVAREEITLRMLEERVSALEAWRAGAEALGMFDR